MYNIDDEYERLVEHLHDCKSKAKSFKTTKRRLSVKTIELMRQRGAARAAGNQELTSELARLCREAIKEDLLERRAEVLAKAAEAEQSILYARRNIVNRKTIMTAIRTLDRTTIQDREGSGKGHSRLLLKSLQQPRPHASSPSKGRWTYHSKGAPFRSPTCRMSAKNRTSAGTYRIKPEQLKYLPLVFINTLARLFTRYLTECKVPKQWKTSKTVLLY